MDNGAEGKRVHVHGGKRLQLRIAGRAIGTHRRAIGREAKHFTWWLLALAFALMLLGVSVGIAFWVQAVVVMVGCLGGSVMALIGYKVIRREVEVLNESYEIYDRLAQAMDLEGGSLAAEGRPNKKLGRLLGGAFGSKETKMETWDWYQFALVVAAAVYFVAFIGALLYAVLK